LKNWRVTATDSSRSSMASSSAVAASESSPSYRFRRCVVAVRFLAYSVPRITSRTSTIGVPSSTLSAMFPPYAAIPSA